jgi:hypothetical protein
MSVIAYHPPKSVSHGHGPRARSVRKAWDATQDFLGRNTTAELRSPLKLSIWGPSQWTDQAVVDAVRSEAAALFGQPTSISGEFHSWELPIERLDEALEFAIADEVRPEQSLGPVRLFVSYSFAWRAMPNPPSSRPSEHFGRGNWLGVSVGGRKVFIQPTFLFGASEQDREFVASLKALEVTMPFVPKDNYYYRVEPKKIGAGEKLVRLHPGWQSAV